jgi:hypothetical protein
MFQMKKQTHKAESSEAKEDFGGQRIYLKQTFAPSAPLELNFQFVLSSFLQCQSNLYFNFI